MAKATAAQAPRAQMLRAVTANDDKEDTALDIRAGILPLLMQSLKPLDEPRNKAGLMSPTRSSVIR